MLLVVDKWSISLYLDYSSTASLSLFGHIACLDDSADAKGRFRLPEFTGRELG